MARYLESKCKLCRRDGVKLFLKGDRCYSDKCAIEKRNYPPGEHGHARFSRRSGRHLQPQRFVRTDLVVLKTDFFEYDPELRHGLGDSAMDHRLPKGAVESLHFALGLWMIESAVNQVDALLDQSDGERGQTVPITRTPPGRTVVSQN